MNNNINAQETNGFSEPKVNFDFATLEEQVDQTRDSAFKTYLSGAPITPQEPEAPEVRISLDQPEYSESYTTKDQIMSKLGLLNDDGTYSDTYTNYINKGGAPLPGYEWAHTEMMAQDRYDQVFKKYDDGEISYDNALMEAYGKDILATMGYDVTSVAYWEKKFQNNDFSHPFSNQYLMDQVKSLAEEYHKQRQASEFGRSNVKETKISSLFGEELSATQVKDIFGDIGRYAKDQQMSDEKLMRLIESGTLDYQARLIQVDEDTYAFLHTDGKLHELTVGEDIKFDKNGNIEEISLNGGDAGDFFDQFFSSFTQAFVNVYKMGVGLYSSMEYFWSHEGGESWTEHIANSLQAVDSVVNSDLGFVSDLARSDYIDTNGFDLFDFKDLTTTFANISGMMLGSMALGSLGSGVSKLGSNLLSSSNLLVKGAGLGVKAVGIASRASTGWYGWANGTAPALFGGNVFVNYGVQVALPQAIRDYYQTVQQIEAVNVMAAYQGSDVRLDAAKRAGTMFITSWGLNTLMGSANNARIWDKYGISTTPKGLEKYITAPSTKQLEAKLLKAGTSEFAKKFAHKKFLLTMSDTFLDGFQTIMGNTVQSYLSATKTDEDGKIVSGADFGDYMGNYFGSSNFVKDLIQQGFMQGREMKERNQEYLSYNTFLQNTGKWSNEYISQTRDKINAMPDSEKKAAANLALDNLVNDIKNGEGSIEENILDAYIKYTDRLGKVPKALEDIINKTDAEEKLNYFRETNAAIAVRKQYIQETTNNFFKEIQTKGLKKAFEKSKQFMAKRFTGVNTKGTNAMIDAYNKLSNDTLENFYKITKITNDETWDKYYVTSDNVTFDKAYDLLDPIAFFGESEENAALKSKLSADPSLYKIIELKQEAEGSRAFGDRQQMYATKATMDLFAQYKGDTIVDLGDGYHYAFRCSDNIINLLGDLNAQTDLMQGFLQMTSNTSDVNGLALVYKALADPNEGDNKANHKARVWNAINLAIKDDILSKEDAAVLVYKLRNMDAPDEHIRNLQDLMNSLPKDSTDAKELEKVVSQLEAVDNIIKMGQSKLKANDKWKGYLSTLYENQTLKGDARKLIDTLYSRGILTVNSDMLENFIAEAALKKGDVSNLPTIAEQLDRILKAPVESGEATQEEVNKLLSSEEYKKVKSGAKKVQTYQDKIEKHTSDKSIVTIDLTMFAGKKTKAAMDIIKAAEETTGYKTDKSHNYGIAGELNTRMKIAQDNGSPVLLLDLDIPEDVETYKQVARELGVYNDFIPETKEQIIASIQEGDTKYGFDKAIKCNKGMEKDYVKFSMQKDLDGASIKMPELKIEGLNVDGSIETLDIVEDMYLKGYFMNVSSKAIKKQKGKHLINLFRNKKEKQSHTGTKLESEGTSAKRGILAGKAEGRKEYYLQTNRADEYDVDDQLGTYFFVRGIIDDAKNNEDKFTFKYYGANKENFITNIKKQGIDEFYDIVQGTKSEPVTLKLKPNVTNDMIKYLDTAGNNFNLFKIIPIISDTPEGPGQYQSFTNTDGTIHFIDKDGNEQIAHIPGTKNKQVHMEDSGRDHVYNVRAEYDADDQLRTKIFGGLAYANDKANEGEDYIFNPFTTSKAYNDGQSREDMLALYEKARNGNAKALKQLNQYAETSYEATMLSRYLQAEQDYTSDDDSDLWRLLLKDKEVLTHLKNKKDANGGTLKYDDTLFNEVKDIYQRNNAKAISAPRYSLDADNMYDFGSGSTYRRLGVAGDTEYMSAAIARDTLGDEYYVDFSDTPEATALAQKAVSDLVDAFNAWKPDDIRSLTNHGNYVSMFQQDNVSKILTGLAGNDAHLPIEDAEYMANLSDEQLNALSERITFKSSQDPIKILRTLRDECSAFVKAQEDLTESFGLKQSKEVKEVTDLHVSNKIDKSNIVSSDKDLSDISARLFTQEDTSDKESQTERLADVSLDNLNEQAKDLLTGIEHEARLNSNSPHNVEVLNLNNTMSFMRQQDIFKNTIDTMIPIIEDEGVRDKIIQDVVTSSVGMNSKREFQKYKAYDEQGNNVLDLSFNGRNYFEFYDKLNSLDNKNLKFFVLEPHSLDSSEGVKFRYLDMAEGNNFEDVKEFFRYKFVEGMMNNTSSERDVNIYLNDLRKMQQDDPAKFRDTFNKYIHNTISTRSYTKAAMTSAMLEQGMSEETALNMLKPSVIGTHTWDNEGLNNFIKGDLKSSLDSNDIIQRTQANAIVFGKAFDINNYSDSEKADLTYNMWSEWEEAWNAEESKKFEANSNYEPKPYMSQELISLVSPLSKLKHGSEEWNTQWQSIKGYLAEHSEEKYRWADMYVALNENPEFVALKTQGKHLMDMKDEKSFEPTLIATDNKGNLLSKKPIKISELLNSPDNVYADLETTIEGQRGDIKDVWQAYFEYTDANGELIERTIFIKHGETADSDEFRNWLARTKIQDNDYYKNQLGYRDSYDKYITNYGHNGDGYEYMSENEYANFIKSLGNKRFVAYNGDTFDFKYISDYSSNKAQFLDAYKLDALENTGADPTRNKLENKAISFKRETHDAKDDTKLMREWMEGKYQNFVDPCMSAKRRAYTELDAMAKELGISSDKLMKHIDNQLDDYRSNHAFARRFRDEQGGMSASSSALYARLINDLRRDNLGRALYSFDDNYDLYVQAGQTDMHSFIKDKQYLNIIDLVAERMVSNPDTTASQAFKDIVNDIKEGMSQKEIERVLASQGESVDTSSEEYKTIRKELDKNKGTFGTKYSLFDSKKDYDTVNNNRVAVTYFYGAKQQLQDLDTQSTLFRDCMIDNLYSSFLSTSGEGGIDDFKTPDAISINSPEAEKILKIFTEGNKVDAIYDYKKDGEFRRILPKVAAFTNEQKNVYEYQKDNGIWHLTKKEGTVDGSTNVVTLDKKAFDKLCNGDPSLMFDENGDAYVLVHREPQVGPTQMGFFKIQIVEGDTGNIWISPAIWRSRFSGDFDGDSITIYGAKSDAEKQIAKIQTGVEFVTADIQENLYSMMAERATLKGAKQFNTKLDEDVVLETSYGAHKSMIDWAKKVDKQLLDGTYDYDDAYKSFTKAAKQIDKSLSKEKIEQLWNVIGVKDGFVHNNTILNDNSSYSNNQYFGQVLRTGLAGTNLLDPLEGQAKKLNTLGLIEYSGDDVHISTATTELAKEISDFISHTEWDADLTKVYVETIRDSIESQLDKRGVYTQNTKEVMKAVASELDTILKDGRTLDADSATTLTKNVFKRIDDAINLDENIQNKYKDVIASGNLSTDYKKEFERRKQLRDLYKDIQGRKMYIPNTIHSDDMVERQLAHYLQDQFDYNGRTDYVDTLSEAVGNHNKVTVAVVEGIPQEAVDTMIMNKNTPLRRFTKLDTIELANSDNEIDAFVTKLLKNPKNGITRNEALETIADMGLQVLEHNGKNYILPKSFIEEYPDVETYLSHSKSDLSQEELYSKIVDLSLSNELLYRKAKQLEGTKTLPESAWTTAIIGEYKTSKQRAIEFTAEENTLLDNVIKSIDPHGVMSDTELAQALHDKIKEQKLDKNIAVNNFKLIQKIKNGSRILGSDDYKNKVKTNSMIKLYYTIANLPENSVLVQSVTDDHKITIGTLESVAGGKGLSIGKGMISEKTFTIPEDSEDKFDFIIPQDALSRSDKIPFRIATQPAEVKEITYVFDGKPITVKAKIFKDTPFFNIENFNRDVEINPTASMTMMNTFGQSRTAAEIATLGNMVYSSDENGNVTYSNRDLISPVLEYNKDNKIAIENGAAQAMQLQLHSLGEIIQKNGWWKDYQVHSYKDFDDDVSGYNVASIDLNDKIIGTFKYIYSKGKYKNFGEILNDMSDYNKRVWDKKLLDALYSYTPYNIKTYTDSDGKIIKLHGKSSAPDAAAVYASRIPGMRYNVQEADVRQTPGVMTNEFYYVPKTLLYQVLNNGVALDIKELYDMTGKGMLGYGRHIKGEQGRGYIPIDESTATIAPAMTQRSRAVDPKTGFIQEQPDTTYIVKPQGSQIDGTSGGYKRGNSAYGSFYKYFTDNSMNYLEGTSKADRIKADIYDLWNSKSTAEGLIRMSGKNYEPEFLFNGISQKYKFGEDGPLLTTNVFQRRGSYNALTSKGRDFVTGKINFYTMKDIYDNYDKEIQDPSKFDTSATKYATKKSTYKDDRAVALQLSQVLKDSRLDLTDNKYEQVFNAPISYKGLGDIKLYEGKENVDKFDSSLMSSSGIKIRSTDQGDTLGVSMGMERSYGEAQWLQAQGDEMLANITKAVRNNHVSDKDFQDYLTYIALSHKLNNNGEDISTDLRYIGITQETFDTQMKDTYNRISSIQGINDAVNQFIQFRTTQLKQISAIYNEPFQNSMMFLSPYVNADSKEIAYGQVHSALRNMLNYSPLTNDGENFKDNMIFSFFDANKKMNREAAKLIGNHYLIDTLKQYKLIDNVDLVDTLQGYLTDNVDVSQIKGWDLKDQDIDEINNFLFDIVNDYTDIDTVAVTKGAKNDIQRFQLLWQSIINKETELQDGIPDTYNKTYSGLTNALAGDLSSDEAYALQEAKNLMTAKILVAQRLMELNPNILTNMDKYFTQIQKQGYAICNEYGQRLAKDSYVTPLGDSSLKYLAHNIEIAANNQSNEKFNQYRMEKALRGELFIAKEDLVKQLEEKVYTTKTPNKVLSLLSKISRTSAGLQMAMPLKMMGRLFRFTGTDYGLGATYSLKTISNMPRAAKELSAAIYSKHIDPDSDLYNYLKWEGQPLNSSGKDPITFSEDLDVTYSNIMDKLTKPLAYQNHYGRYAIWLTAKESFENGDPIYGPVYFAKDSIDKLGSPEAKATYIMDYMIGSPGGFPYITKKTNGLMMYTTFPMNLTRTAGAYAMSVGKLFQEGFTRDNASQWMKTITSPSAATVMMAYLSTALITAVCEKYGVDDKKRDEWIEEQQALDPLGTLLGGTPSFVNDSMIPLYQLKEMYASPFTNEYNKNFGDKALGFVNKNFLSKLNPAIKAPVEVALQKDFYGDSLVDSSNISRLESGLKKGLGFLAGSGVANSIVNQFNRTDDNSDFISKIGKGIRNGFANDLGNQKSWKKDISNYYSVLDSIKSYQIATAKTYGATYEDLTDAEYLRGQRNSTSSYGELNSDDYSRVNKKLRQMINDRENPTTIYMYIAEEYNKGTSEATLRKALNNNSLVRKLNQINKKGYYDTLSSKDIHALEKALAWEKETYPILEDFFPSNTRSAKKSYAPSYYKKSLGGGSYSSTPKIVRPGKINYYPYSGYANKKLSVKNPKASINKVKVDVSPQMGVWTQDYNKTIDLSNWRDSNYNRVKPLNHGGGK